MKNQLFNWIIIIGVIIFVFIAVNDQINYGGGINTRSKEKVVLAGDLEYEYVEESQPPQNVEQPVQTLQNIIKSTESEVKKIEIVIQEKPAQTIEIVHQDAAFSIQIASFQDKVRAEKAMKDAKEKGYFSTIVSRDLVEQGIWYRIYVGTYETKQAAQEVLTKIKVIFPGSFIKTVQK